MRSWSVEEEDAKTPRTPNIQFLGKKPPLVNHNPPQTEETGSTTTKAETRQRLCLCA